MRETSLEKVLRLAGGVTRSYVRTDSRTGQLERVSQYVSRRDRQAGRQPQAGRTVRLPAGQLRQGHVVQVGNSRYTVVRTGLQDVPGRSLGPGVNTGGPASTASAGPGVNTGSPNPQQALLNGVRVPPGTSMQTSEWRDNATGARWFVRLPASLPVPVVA